MGTSGVDDLFGRAGDDTMVGDEGKDTFELVVPMPDDAGPVVILDYEFVCDDGFPELVSLVDADGNPLDDVSLADDLEVRLSEDETGTELLYQGKTIAVIKGIAPETLEDTSHWISNLVDPTQTTPPDVEVVTIKTDATELVLTSATGTGHIVTDALFGGNAVFNINTDNGVPFDNFKVAQDEFGIFHLRYPAGQGDTGDREIDGEGFPDVVKMEPNEDGEMDLRPELKEMLDWATEDGEIKLTLVIPTKTGTVDEYLAFGDDIEAFAEKVMTDYGDVVEAFEIGNEYWSTIGETEYSAKPTSPPPRLPTGWPRPG